MHAHRTHRIGAVLATALLTGAAGLAAATAEPALYMKRVEPGMERTRILMDAPPGAFADERRIVDAVRDHYGDDAVMSNGRNLSPELEAAMVQGRPLPDGAPVRKLPDKLVAELPAGPEWRGVGEHLVGLGPDGRMEIIVHEVLP